MKALNASSLHLFALQVRLAAARIGWSTGIPVLFFVIGAASLLWFVPHLRAQGELQQRALLRAQNALTVTDDATKTARPSTTEARLVKFYDALGEKRYAEQQIKTLFAIAGKVGLNLNQADFKSAYDKNSNTHTYQIQLPVKGSYAAIRQFCEQTLLAIPFASLDEMTFKRDTIGRPVLEAKLRITLYLAAAPAAPENGGERK